MQRLKRLTRPFTSTWSFRARLVRGGSSADGEGLSVLLGGPEAHVAYLTKVLFQGEPVVEDLGRRSTFQVRALAESEDVGLVFIPVHEFLVPFMGRGRAFFIPWWVSGEIEVRSDLMERPWSKALDSDLRRFEQFDYHYRVTKQPEDFESYYHSMYLPLVTRAHADTALPATLESVMEKILDGGELLQILRDGEVVAGQILTYEQGKPHVRNIGVKNGDRQLMREGVVSACNVFTMRYLDEHGYLSWDDGNCRAFLMDGSLRYKRKWGLRLNGHSAYGCLLQIRRPSEVVWNLLAKTPFLHRGRRGLESTHFVGESTTGVAGHEALLEEPVIPGLRAGSVYMKGQDGRPVRVAHRSYTS